jgi:serine/threonine-protein kinase
VPPFENREPTPSSLVGHRLAGRYRIEAVIAKGGMGTIFRATQLQEPREVAVKVMREDLAQDRSFVSRFRREARFAARLSHPNLVRVMDSGAEGGTYFLVMELLRGEDLFSLLARERRLDERAAVDIMSDVCAALAEVHGHGIVHRDLKPENIFLTRSASGARVVKVLDFGIARRAEEPARRVGTSTPNLTIIGAMIGTPEYMSPEQCRGERPGPAADVYACGALLYAMITGHPPFTGENPVLVAARQVGEQPTPPSELRPTLNRHLEEVVLRALSKDPRDRYQDAIALGRSLGALRDEISAEAPLPYPMHEPLASCPTELQVRAPGGTPAAAEVRTEARRPRPTYEFLVSCPTELQLSCQNEVVLPYGRRVPITGK